MFLDFVTWPPFTEMCDAQKRWPSDKVKEHCETNLSVQCCAHSFIKIWSIQMASPEYKVTASYRYLVSYLLLSYVSTFVLYL